MALSKNISIILLMVNSLSAMFLPKETLFVPQRLGEVEVSYQDDIFMVNNTRVQRYDLDPVLREVKTEDHLKALLRNSKLSVSRYDDGEYKLATMGGLDGGGRGGVILGAIGYVAIKGAIPFAMGYAAYKDHRQTKKEKKARKKYLKKHGPITKDDFHSMYVDEHFGSISENIETFADRAGAAREGYQNLILGEGISYALDELGSRRIISNEGDRTYQATLMGMDQGSIQGASSGMDALAKAVFVWCSQLPF